MDKLYAVVFLWVIKPGADGATFDVKVSTFWVAALNEDEARGMAWRAVTQHVPEAFVSTVVKTTLYVTEAPHVPPGTVKRGEGF